MRFAAIIVLIVVMLVVGVGCYLWIYKAHSSSQEQGKVTIRGAGATFPLLQVERWIADFSKEYPDIVITYQGVGSGAGQSQFFAGAVDFCGSDPPLTRRTWERYKDRVMQIPYLLGAVVVVYNIPDLNGKTLNLSAQALALIYRGDIVYWDDPRIARLNPGVKLPHKEIKVVYRADASGTQQIFTLYLHKAVPNIWPKEWVSKTMKSPIAKSGRALAGKGNPGVVQIIKNTLYSIGFVEWSYAIKENLPIAAIENACGEFVKPSIESLVEAAKAAARQLPKDPRGDFSSDLDLIVYANACKAYPLTSWTHLILWTSYNDEAKAEALAKFLRWIYEKGYSNLVPGYAPPPEDVRCLLLDAARIVESSS